MSQERKIYEEIQKSNERKT